MIRFTTWLTDREAYELERISEELRFSKNQVLRIAFRVGVGLPEPAAGLVHTAESDQQHGTAA
jgi:hypothetical protein